MRTQYHTRQQEELLNYLRTTEGRHITAAEVCAHFRSLGLAIGTATVYRHLERMVAEGIVAKYQVDGSSGACFEYLSREKSCHPQNCFHCKCEDCGKLIHLHCHEVAALGRHLQAGHGFALDPLRTVFYGLCSECSARRAR